MNTKTRIGALAMVALMVAVAVPVATADTWSEARATWVRQKANYLENRAAALEAYATWLEDKTLANRKDVAIKMGNSRLAYLELVKSGVDMTRGLSDDEKAPLLAELDNYITTLQGYTDTVSGADGVSAVREAISAAWNYWLSIRVRVKQISATLVVARAEVVLWRCEALAAKVEAKVQELKDNGVDTTQLEAWLADFDSHIALAQQRITNAEENIANINDNVTFQEMYLVVAAHAKAASSYLRSTLSDLRSILSDIRSDGYTVTLSGAGTLTASGSGTADLSGTGVMKITAIENGVLTVSADVKNLKIDEESMKDNLDSGQLTYQGFSTAMVTGTDMTVSIFGSNITLSAHGQGTATLTNWSGSYRTYGENNYEAVTLTSEDATVTVETGETAG